MDGLGLVDQVAVLLEVVNVREEPRSLLALGVFAVLLEDIASGLLRHHDIYSFIGGGRSKVLPRLNHSRSEGEASSTTSLAKLVHTFVGDVCSDSFDTRSEVVQHVKQLEVIVFQQFIGF